MFYRVTDTRVFILRLIHGSRDITPALFVAAP
jgi:plasmid stabilization system protein ParE